MCARVYGLSYQLLMPVYTVCHAVALASGGSPSSTGVLPLAHTTHPGEAMMPPEVRGVVGERPGTAESSSYGYGYTATRRLSG